MKLITAYSYGCLMARVGEPLAEAIRVWGETIPDDRLFDDGSGEKGREKTPHVTVKYGLHTSDPDEVIEKVSGWAPFKFVLGRTSVFHGEGKSIVLKLGVRSPELFRLNRHVSNVFECTDTFPEYRPHVTIAYLVRDEEDPYYYREYGTDAFSGAVVTVDELDFSTPEGKHVMIPLNGR